eukprot:m.249131 g.249131  ORF g.249131 m.249131 type:complete len:61 (+) comp54496_c1_seq2:2270-2452(+)
MCLVLLSFAVLAKKPLQERVRSVLFRLVFFRFSSSSYLSFVSLFGWTNGVVAKNVLTGID